MKAWHWIAISTVVIGGGVAAYFLLGKKKDIESETVNEQSGSNSQSANTSTGASSQGGNLAGQVGVQNVTTQSSPAVGITTTTTNTATSNVSTATSNVTSAPIIDANMTAAISLVKNELAKLNTIAYKSVKESLMAAAAQKGISLADHVIDRQYLFGKIPNTVDKMALKQYFKNYTA